MYRIKVSEKEIDEVLNAADEQETKGGSQWKGMTYEQGVSAAIRWLLGMSDENPMQDG